ncbi:hypothetical protein ACFIOY_38930 [Bradyrhizobium sp. TZ2]
MTFTALSEAQWEAIRSTRTKWPNGIDWRREIELVGQDYWDALATREMWVKKLRGKQPAMQRKKVYKALLLTQQSDKALARLENDGLLDDDFLHPDLKSPENRLEAWLSDYDFWVRPFAGKSNPIQTELEWRLIHIWKRSGGKVNWSRKTYGHGTPYGPLVEFLTLTLDAILGKVPGPSGIAKMIDRHRGEGSKYDPFLMFAMHHRITKTT